MCEDGDGDFFYFTAVVKRNTECVDDGASSPAPSSTPATEPTSFASSTPSSAPATAPTPAPSTYSPTTTAPSPLPTTSLAPTATDAALPYFDILAPDSTTTVAIGGMINITWNYHLPSCNNEAASSTKRPARTVALFVSDGPHERAVLVAWDVPLEQRSLSWTVDPEVGQGPRTIYGFIDHMWSVHSDVFLVDGDESALEDFSGTDDSSDSATVISASAGFAVVGLLALCTSIFAFQRLSRNRSLVGQHQNAVESSARGVVADVEMFGLDKPKAEETLGGGGGGVVVPEAEVVGAFDADDVQVLDFTGEASVPRRSRGRRRPRLAQGYAEVAVAVESAQDDGSLFVRVAPSRAAADTNDLPFHTRVALASAEAATATVVATTDREIRVQGYHL